MKNTSTQSVSAVHSAMSSSDSSINSSFPKLSSNLTVRQMGMKVSEEERRRRNEEWIKNHKARRDVLLEEFMNVIKSDDRIPIPYKDYDEIINWNVITRWNSFSEYLEDRERTYGTIYYSEDDDECHTHDDSWDENVYIQDPDAEFQEELERIYAEQDNNVMYSDDSDSEGYD